MKSLLREGFLAASLTGECSKTLKKINRSNRLSTFNCWSEAKTRKYRRGIPSCRRCSFALFALIKLFIWTALRRSFTFIGCRPCLFALSPTFFSAQYNSPDLSATGLPVLGFLCPIWVSGFFFLNLFKSGFFKKINNQSIISKIGQNLEFWDRDKK